MFLPTTTPKSPRMVPGALADGLVAPIKVLALATTPLPSQTKATTGPEVMKSIKPPKNGRSLCSA